MPRPTWSGAISFGLVSVPVGLFTAQRSHDVRFRQLHRGTNNPVKQKRVDATTGEEVAYEDIVKGYEVEPDRYVTVDPEELSQLDPEASRTIDIHDFVDQSEIDPIYYERAYYLGPDGQAAAKPYRLLAEAMERANKVAIASFVMRAKEYLAAIRARDGMLLLSTMYFADEVADPAEIDVDGDVRVDDREVDMAERLIDSLVTSFDPGSYADSYQQRVLEFLEAKAEGQHIEVASDEPSGGKVLDLTAALEQSLARAQRDRAKEAPAPTSSPDYDAMTRDELYELAKQRDVPGRSRLSKDELVAALREADAAASAA